MYHYDEHLFKKSNDVILIENIQKYPGITHHNNKRVEITIIHRVKSRSTV